MTSADPASVSRAPIAVALDTGDLARAAAIARAVAGAVTTMKIGLELFSAEGPGAVEKLRIEAPALRVMLDLKLHDIPATVRGAARSLSALAPDILTVHALGGEAMIAAAVAELPSTAVAAVTVLTSHDAAELDRLGVAGPPESAAVRLARLAVDAGARAVVCSPQEVAAIRTAVGPAVELITPGVRPTGSDAGDQARIATPAGAVAAGADLLVVGRPITAATDPGGAAAAIARELLAATG